MDGWPVEQHSKCQFSAILLIVCRSVYLETKFRSLLFPRYTRIPGGLNDAACIFLFRMLRENANNIFQLTGMCKKIYIYLTIIIQLYNLYSCSNYTLVQFDVYSKALQFVPTRSIARIKLNPPSSLLPNVIYNLQLAPLFLLEISQVSRGSKDPLCLFYVFPLISCAGMTHVENVLLQHFLSFKYI